jgi:acetamidase/formamidase
MIKHAAWVCCALSIAANAAAQTSARTYELKATPETTFYRFLDASTKPVLTITSGDIVKLETATGTPGYFERVGVAKDKIPAELYETFKGVDDNARRDHTLTGPIFVTGAEPGDSIEIRLHKGKTLRLPRAETPTEYMTMGFHEDLDEAVRIATREMLDWLVEMKGLTREDAFLLASVAMDLRVTQVVDGNKGIHAVIAKSIFKR